MRGKSGSKYDFFLSRRGSVADVAREVADALIEEGYKVLVQDYDIPFAASFVEAMHEAIKNSRDLIILFTRDYEESPYTRKEFTSFEAERAQSLEERHVIILRCEDVPLRGLLADNVFQDLVDIADPIERRRRVIAAVERKSQGNRPPLRPFVGVPPRIASFTGRADELDRLDAILVPNKPAALTQVAGRAAVQGLGGVGKTSLAIEYAHRFRSLYAGVWWAPAETRAGLLVSLAALAASREATATDEADVERAAKQALRWLAEQRTTWLLVYDNVIDPDAIADLLPAGGAQLLITSRFSDWSGWAEDVPLEVFSPAEAVALLEARTRRDDQQGARLLSQSLGFLPLALDHAVAYCKRTLTSFSEYAAKVESHISSVPRGVAYPRSAAATFDLAIEAAAAQCHEVEFLMAYLAQCGPERIPMTLVEGAIADEARRATAMLALSEVSLIKHDSFEDGIPGLTVHRVVRVVARTRSESRGFAKSVAAQIVARLFVIYPRNGISNPDSWPLCAKLTPHLLALRQTHLDGAARKGIWADLLNRAGSYFHGRASYAQAESLLQEALSIREKEFGPKHAVTAQSLNNLANLFQDQRDVISARPLFERSLAIREKALGPSHPATARSLNNLARLFHNDGDFVQAQPLYERALAIREKTMGAEHPETAASLNNLAEVLQDRGDLTAAKPFYERALAIRERVLGAKHPYTALSLNSLACLLREQGDPARARPLLEGAIVVCEETLGPEHPNTARVKSNLAGLLLDDGDPLVALDLGTSSLSATDTILGANHSWTLEAARVVFDALLALGRSEEAEVLSLRYDITNKASIAARRIDDVLLCHPVKRTRRS